MQKRNNSKYQILFLNSKNTSTTDVTSHKVKNATVKSGFSAFGLLLLLSFMASASMYLVKINTNIVRGDAVYEQELEVKKLKLERDELRILQAQARSRAQEGNVVERYKMEPISFSQYVDLSSPTKVAADF